MAQVRFLASFVALTFAACALHAQAPAPAPAPAAASAVPQYGANVTQEQARRLLAAAMADARRINVPMAVAIVDTAGNLVAFERMENTQTASIQVAQDKGVSAAIYRRPTKVFQDALAGGGAGLRILSLRGANAVEGGLPINVDGRIIGGIGVSGGSSEQDGEVARAALGSLAR
jgi:glc operon protein GlcG